MIKGQQTTLMECFSAREEQVDAMIREAHRRGSSTVTLRRFNQATGVRCVPIGMAMEIFDDSESVVPAGKTNLMFSEPCGIILK